MQSVRCDPDLSPDQSLVQCLFSAPTTKIYYSLKFMSMTVKFLEQISVVQFNTKAMQ